MHQCILLVCEARLHNICVDNSNASNISCPSAFDYYSVYMKKVIENFGNYLGLF